MPLHTPVHADVLAAYPARYFAAWSQRDSNTYSEPLKKYRTAEVLQVVNFIVSSGGWLGMVILTVAGLRLVLILISDCDCCS